MPLQSQCIVSLLLFVVRNRELLGLILMYITLMQDIILIYIYFNSISRGSVIFWN